MELRHWWEHGHEKNKNKLAGWKAFIDKLFAKVLWLSELPRCKERRILLDQNISKVEQIVNSAVITEEGKCQKNMGGGGRGKDLLRYDTVDIYLAKTWSEQ